MLCLLVFDLAKLINSLCKKYKFFSCDLFALGRGVFVFENGRIIGGDNRQYSMGSYKVTDERINAELKIHYYGPPRTVFGEKSEEFTVQMDAIIKDGTIDGMLSRRDKANMDLQYRLPKRMALPKG